VARTGRTGTAFLLVAGGGVCYFIDLQLFLGNSVNIVFQNSPSTMEWHNWLRSLGQHVYDDCTDIINTWHDDKQDLYDMAKVASNGYKMYLKSRTGASVESVKRARKLKAASIGVHPITVRESTEVEEERADFLEQMKNFRPVNTIFETGNTAKSAEVRLVMCGNRSAHGEAIGRHKHRRDKDLVLADREKEDDVKGGHPEVKRVQLEESSTAELEDGFADRIVRPKQAKNVKLFQKKSRAGKARDFHTEAGYSLMNNFEKEAKGAVLDLNGDDDNSNGRKRTG
jgi:ATP-dependent RNA helicase DDX54/DBP10